MKFFEDQKNITYLIIALFWTFFDPKNTNV